MEPKKLRRSYKDKTIGGVSGGLGEYFTTDPLIFRILFIVLLFSGGGGFIIYLLMWIFIPLDKSEYGDSFGNSTNEENEATIVDDDSKENKSSNGSIIGGSILIVIGLFFLLDNLWPWLDFADLWPIALVVAGLAIVKMNYTGKNNDNEDDNKDDDAEPSAEL